MDLRAKEYWNNYYEKHAFARGKAPSSFVVETLSRLQKGLVLDVAMGEGANAVYLAQKGNTVEGFDISEVACKRAATLARDTGVEVKTKCTDMDLYLLGIMKYDTIIMTYFRPGLTRYYPEMIKSLKQGGTLLIESYLVTEMGEAIPREEGYRNYFFAANEVLAHLKGMRLLNYQEGKVNGRDALRCFAKKPVDRDAIKYGLFDMHTKQDKQQTSPHLELAEKLFKKN